METGAVHLQVKSYMGKRAAAVQVPRPPLLLGEVITHSMQSVARFDCTVSERTHWQWQVWRAASSPYSWMDSRWSEYISSMHKVVQGAANCFFTEYSHSTPPSSQQHAPKNL